MMKYPCLKFYSISLQKNKKIKYFQLKNKKILVYGMIIVQN